MNKKKPVFCPYKEYWFGYGEEAQAKPSGFKYKRGTLLKLKSTLATGYETVANGKNISYTNGLRHVDDKSVLLLLNYDSTIVSRRVLLNDVTMSWANSKASIYEHVEAVKHQFTFLFGEKIESLTLVTWGEAYKTTHNEMWHKARHPRVLPQKKRKKPPKGFCLDD